ncbi:hypothetical protein [Aquamicrobium sp. LC103]|uniref:hypothetical protein n=1 Tax=Aquamicrobium sp. LC103 TaxID=1120658 RepID=UPI00063EC528|nr:hypothetical protein [Aquamicrobium sp. LC103]TKT74201.1 hypothetical protein XW59_024625 [Aquamicrobium sp. LC103]
MEEVRQIARMCVGRAVMFGTLAILCIMVSFAFSLALAFRAGAILMLLMAGILLIKAHLALRQKPKNTEVWIYLDDGARPRNDHANRLFARVLHEVYCSYAQTTFVIACSMFAISLALSAVL